MFNSVKVLCSKQILAGLSGCQTTTSYITTSAQSEKLAQINTELAFQYIQQRNYEAALEKIKKALKKRPNYAAAQNTMGLLHIQLGQMKQAETSFKKAISIEPEDPTALNNYGQFLCQVQFL